MRHIGFSLIELGTGNIVWTGQLPSRVELRDGNGAVTLRADFDRAGLVVPDEENATHRMVERWEMEAAQDRMIRSGDPSELFDGEFVVVDPHWTVPPVEDE